MGTQQPIRVLHVLGALNRAGAETWLMNVLRHIDRERFRLDFLVHTTAAGAYDPEVRALGSRIFPCLGTRNPLAYCPRSANDSADTRAVRRRPQPCACLLGLRAANRATSRRSPADRAQPLRHVDARHRSGAVRRAYLGLMNRGCTVTRRSDWL